MSSEPAPAMLPPGQGRTTWQLGHEFTTKASRAVTRGAYTMLEQVCAGPPPPLHIHDNEEEALYVLDGTIDIFLGDEVVDARAGTFCMIPRGTAHSYRSTGPTPARLLLILSPPGFERFFAEVERRFPRESGLPPADIVEPALAAIVGQYGLRIVGPPPG